MYLHIHLRTKQVRKHNYMISYKNITTDDQIGSSYSVALNVLAFPLEHRFPKLNVALFGNSAAVKYGCHNFLLGQKQVCVAKEIPEHHVSVINMIGLHEIFPNHNHIIGQILKENGIHVFIFVVRLGQLTNTVKMGIEWLQRTFGYKVLSFAMILLTYEREEECHNIPYIHPVLEKCGGRHHTCSIIMNNHSQMKELMDKIKQLFIDNNKQCYTAKMYNAALTELQNNTFLSGKKIIFFIHHFVILIF